MNDDDERFKVINHAWIKLNEVFSFDAVRENIIKFIKEIS